MKDCRAPVKLIACVLFGSGVGLQEEVYGELEAKLGVIDYEGEDHPFDMTDYYSEEMGKGLLRRVISFAGTVCADELAGFKIYCAEIERRFSEDGKRRINIDIGYIDFFKVVLASFKEGPQKIYLGKGVYADMNLLYQNGGFTTLPWSFPDMKTGRYNNDFTAIRARYKEEMK